MESVKKFIKTHKNIYKEYLIKNRLEKCNYGYTCDIDQIYCHLNKIDINSTVYKKFYDLSKKYFNFDDKKIIEIASGYIPILSNIYKNNGYNIVALNEKFLYKRYKSIKMIEIDYNKFNEISLYDIVVAIRPCSITEKIIDDCIKYKKNFIIYLCPCIHETKNKKFSSYEEWINFLKNKLKKYQDYIINFITEESFPDNCPIIVGKYKKDIN